MQYLLLIHASEAKFAALTKDEAEQAVGAYAAYTETLKNSGVLLGLNRLQPTSATTRVRIADGKTEVLNGPYAETKEQLGGYYLIDVPDLDVAISWAARCPGAAYGTMEVRPVWVICSQ